MECSLSSPLNIPSASVVFPSNSSRHFSSLHLRQLVGFHHSRCQKMFVPGFGEASPESKAAVNLHHFFTFVAIKIVLGQLQSYNREAYEELMEFVNHNSLNDGDQFCRRLMRESPRLKGLALRIMEVRSAYCKRDFEWVNLQKLAYKEGGTGTKQLFILQKCLQQCPFQCSHTVSGLQNAAVPSNSFLGKQVCIQISNIFRISTRIILCSEMQPTNMSSFWERTERWDTNQAHTETTTDKEASWKDLGTSMNEISFGFVATAILISMFIIMAIFEHLIRPNQSTEQSQNENQVSFGENQQQSQSQSVVKLGSSKPEVVAPTPDLSVLMPGQRFPTFLAQPAPLLPCPREGIYWPSHHRQAFDCP